MKIADIVHIPVEATAAYRRRSMPINDYQLLAAIGCGQELHQHQDRLALKMRGANIPFETLFAMQINDLELDADVNLSVRHGAKATFLCKLDHVDYEDLQALARARQTMDGPLFGKEFLPPDEPLADEPSGTGHAPGGASPRIVPLGQRSPKFASEARSRRGTGA